MTLLWAGCAGAKVRQYRVEVVKEYPHDVKSYTQGLFFEDGQLYESTGQYGQSTFRKVDLKTGEPQRKLDFSRKYFVEGSVMFGNELFVLTWTNRVAFVYDASTLEYKATYSYPREGWGLTTDGESLIASDGSASLYFMGKDFRVSRKVTVKMNGQPVRFLNELEYIDGKIWANVYTSDLIVIIDPATGNVEAVVDCTCLLPDRLRTGDTDVLNGIAYNPADRKIYLTGKNWPKLYEVRLVAK
ncbi:MAG: glutaminyl-peptide cyclotransferase [Bacteroidales bacterium]|nr:glutaminyl-peptide cyclotransferase [Bacteroidales bacterium]